MIDWDYFVWQDFNGDDDVLSHNQFQMLFWKISPNISHIFKTLLALRALTLQWDP